MSISLLGDGEQDEAIQDSFLFQPYVVKFNGLVVHVCRSQYRSLCGCLTLFVLLRIVVVECHNRQVCIRS